MPSVGVQFFRDGIRRRLQLARQAKRLLPDRRNDAQPATKPRYPRYTRRILTPSERRPAQDVFQPLFQPKNKVNQCNIDIL